MSLFPTKPLAACAVALAAALLCAAPAEAARHTKKSAVAAAKAAKSTDSKPTDPDAAEPDVSASTPVEYQCELGNKITIYSSAGDDSHIALRWKARLARLTRVLTTTGAQRFENASLGLVWIGIPTKGMLLDSKNKHQLANECKNPEQATVATPPAKQG